MTPCYREARTRNRLSFKTIYIFITNFKRFEGTKSSGYMYVLITCIQEEPEDGPEARNIMRMAGSTIKTLA